MRFYVHDSAITPRARFNFASLYGLCAFSVALVVHVLTFTDHSMSPDNPLFWILHIGIFPLFFAMIWRLRKWSEKAPAFLGLRASRLQWRKVIAYLPWWAVGAGAILFVYALINFTNASSHLPSGHHGSSAPLGPLKSRYLVRAFSGHWLIFYALPTLFFLFVPTRTLSSDSNPQGMT